MKSITRTTARSFIAPEFVLSPVAKEFSSLLLIKLQEIFMVK